MPSLGSYLQPVLNTGIQLKDYQHASRLYVDDVFALAPKAGWLYYVVFDIDPSALTDTTWDNQQRVSEVGMLVKSADLPKFSIQTETVNQYNRKTVIQKGVNYNPVNLVLHDDQSNVVHNMWLNYFRYYYADSTWAGTGPIGTAKDNTPGAYQNNKYLPANDLFNPINYGMNSKLVVAPFFRSITIYQLNRKLFTSYKLVNPIIQTWEHDKLDQTNGSRLAESKMSVAYETVFYGAGRVKKDTPTGFAMFHYDTSPSPLSLAGGGNNSVFGPGGVVAGALDIFGDVSNVLNPDSKVSPLGVLGTVIKGANLVRNVQGITKESLRAEGYKILNDTLRDVASGSLNGLGINLKLSKGENYVTAGQFLGTPVAVVTAAAIGQEFGVGGTTSQPAPASGTPPSSADAKAASTNKTDQIDKEQKQIDDSEMSKSTDDTTPSGNTPASGSYYPPVQPLTDTDPYIAFVDEESTPEDVQLALDDLQSAWAADNEYVNSQSPDPTVVSDRLSSANSDEEYTAMKADADKAFEATRELQSVVDAKYYAEYDRLTALLSAKQSTAGSGNVQLTPDPDSELPSIEASSTDIDIEEI